MMLNKKSVDPMPILQIYTIIMIENSIVDPNMEPNLKKNLDHVGDVNIPLIWILCALARVQLFYSRYCF